MAQPACRHRDTCRLCESRDLQRVLQLAPTPPANAFVPETRKGQPQETYPLDVYFCRGCAHVQLLDVVDPAILFRDYVYVSGTSPVFVEHFRKYAQSVVERMAGIGRKPASVLEIGSNDGTLLRFFQKEHGARVLGIDPATKIAETATAAGVPTLPEFFSGALGARLRKERGAFDLVVANNVFAHIDDLSDIVAGVKAALAPGGAFVFEVSYLVDVVEKTLFDTIYHEHLSYHSLVALEAFFRRNGMELFDAERVSSHGGSLRAFARLQAPGTPAPSPRVAELIALERKLGLDRPETFERFAADIAGLRTELSALLRRLKGEGKRIAGFGAPAKATTLLHHFGLGADVIEFIVDDSPWKQGLYSPGHHIPVVPASAIRERKPDYLVLLAWNFADPIIAKNEEFRRAGGKFIVPVPKVKVV